MSLSTQDEWLGMQAISEAVATTLRQMREYARPGMSTRELDEYGQARLEERGTRSAPKLTDGFPGWTCIRLNDEICHGIPSSRKILKEGDLVNIDVSAELNGYWADNGGSFVLGQDLHGREPLVQASRTILNQAISRIKGGVKLAEIGRFIELETRKRGYTVLRNLAGHGVGRSLHEAPSDIVCYYDRTNTARFRKHSVVAIETFISTRPRYAQEKGDGWTMVTPGGYAVQHEHTIVVTDGEPVILTAANAL